MYIKTNAGTGVRPGENDRLDPELEPTLEKNKPDSDQTVKKNRIQIRPYKNQLRNRSNKFVSIAQCLMLEILTIFSITLVNKCGKISSILVISFIRNVDIKTGSGYKL